MNIEHRNTFLSGPQVQARYGISDVTLFRWLKNDSLGFPRPLVINRRRLFNESEIVEWERQRAKGTA